MRDPTVLVTLLALIMCLLGAPANAEIESWYTYWSLGLARHSYDPSVRSFIDDAQGISGAFTRSEHSIDGFGFYWPTGSATIAGFVISSTYDRLYKVDPDEPHAFSELFSEFPFARRVSHYLSLRQTLYGASIMHFLGQEPGEGFFLRGDTGMAVLRIESELAAPIGDRTGYGILGGMGYGLPISEGTRLLFGISYAFNRIGGHNYGTAILNVGGLW